MQRYFEKMKPYLKKDSPAINVIVMGQHPSGAPGVMATGLDGMTAGQGQGPNVPQHMIQTAQGPRMLHADEGTRQNPDGSVQVVPQRVLKLLEQNPQMAAPTIPQGGAPQQPPPPQQGPAPQSAASPMAMPGAAMPGMASGGVFQPMYPAYGASIISQNMGFPNNQGLTPQQGTMESAAPQPQDQPQGMSPAPMPGYANGGITPPPEGVDVNRIFGTNDPSGRSDPNAPKPVNSGDATTVAYTTGSPGVRTTDANGNRLQPAANTTGSPTVTPTVGAQTGYNNIASIAAGGSPQVAAAAQTARETQYGTNVGAQGVTAQLNAADPYATAGAKNAAMARTIIGGEGAMSTLNQTINQQDLAAREQANRDLISNASTMQTVGNAAEQDLAGWAQAHSGQDWANDATAITKGKALFAAAGGNVNDAAAFKTYMDSAWASASKKTNAIDEAFNVLTTSVNYNFIDGDKTKPRPATRAEADAMKYTGLSKQEMYEITELSVNGGYAIGRNADQSVYITNSKGDVISGVKQKAPTPPVVISDEVKTTATTLGLSPEEVQAYKDAKGVLPKTKAEYTSWKSTPRKFLLTDPDIKSSVSAINTSGGEDITPARVIEYADLHDGKVPTTPQEIQNFLDWDKANGSMESIVSYFKSASGKPLGDGDARTLTSAIAAKGRVDTWDEAVSASAGGKGTFLLNGSATMPDGTAVTAENATEIQLPAGTDGSFSGSVARPSQTDLALARQLGQIPQFSGTNLRPVAQVGASVDPAKSSPLDRILQERPDGLESTAIVAGLLAERIGTSTFWNSSQIAEIKKNKGRVVMFKGRPLEIVSVESPTGFTSATRPLIRVKTLDTPGAPEASLYYDGDGTWLLGA